MAIQPTYPGVYIEEIPSGVRTITGVSTSIAAFIDYFKRGPMNKAVQIFNFGDFERIFGGLDAKSEASYAIDQFFMNGGRQAYVVRVAGGTPRSSSVEISDTVGGDTVLKIKAISEGIWGDNIGIKIEHSTSNQLFNIFITEYNDKSLPLRHERFLNLSMTSVEAIINDENSGSKIIRIDKPVGSKIPVANGTMSVKHPPKGVKLNGTDHKLKITFTEGAAKSTETVDLKLPTLGSGETHYKLSTIAISLENAIRETKLDDTRFANVNVSVVEDHLYILAGGKNAKIITTFTDVSSDKTATNLKLTGDGVANLQEYRLGTGAISSTAQKAGIGGNNGGPPDARALIGNLNEKKGLYAFEDVDLFNILCIPRAAMVSGDNPMSEIEAETTIARAIEYCEQKRAFFIMDTPNNIQDLPGIQSWIDSKTTLRSDYAALYFPRLNIADPLNGFRLRSFGASGTMAGLYARTDADRGVWKAPAGTDTNLRNVTQITYKLTDSENGVLNPIAVNCLRTFPIYGNICWGGRTLSGADAMASQWKYIPVRRLALFIEESLFRGTQWVVFEPNDEALWAQIRLNVGAFMNNLFRQGAFQGANPKDAYFVQCNSETTTQNDRDLGIVNVEVGFAPLKPAEFVIIKIKQLAGQILA